MNHARRNTLQDRLSAMTRVLPGLAAAALVFSLVFFSPLTDLKDSIAAAAKSRSEQADHDSDRNHDKGNRSDDHGNQDKHSRPEAEATGKVENSKTDHSENTLKEPASEKPGSASVLRKFFGQRPFVGDSAPSGGSLSPQQEREAIQNGWK